MRRGGVAALTSAAAGQARPQAGGHHPAAASGWPLAPVTSGPFRSHPAVSRAGS